MACPRKVLRGIAWACTLIVAYGCADKVQEQPARTQTRAASVGEVPDVGLTIELTGSGVDHPTVFTFEQLARMEMVQLDGVLMQKSHEPDEKTSWRGPPLDALLSAARIKPGPMDLTLEAADGYAIDCTLQEMKSAIVALQDGDGRWLAERDKRRPLRLVAPHETGNYWVSNLTRVIVEPADSGE
ncbi:MAG: molybdopterin-dependent oxidoreductase [Phycisphaerae bacterium]|nr:molybdopterin-dependent oxidoreductase [Phycisphaerae bacterium]